MSNDVVIHPSALALEAFAVGETKASVETHLAECSVCASHVERLRGALSAGRPSKSKAADLVARVAAKVERDEKPANVAEVRSIASARKSPSPWIAAATVVVPLAIAAAILLLLRGPSTTTKDVAVVTPQSPSTSAAPSVVVAQNDPPSDPEITFKGGIQIAVIREREGQQARFTSTVSVKPGDRLRVEVALDREQAILAAVLGDDASWLELMSEGVRRPGTHFSEKSARVDAEPLRGTILVGTPEAVARARQTRHFEDVSVVRIDWEGSP